VLTTPVIRGLKQQLTGAEVHFLVKEQYRGVVEHNPYIDKLHTLTPEGLKPLIARLQNENYDYIADLHKNIRSHLLKRKLHAPSASFNKLNLNKWLKVNFRVDTLPDIHIAERYFEAVKSLGVINDGRGLDYFLPVPEPDIKAELPETHRNEYVVVVIGAKHYTKAIPYEKIISFGSRVQYPVVLAGGIEDAEKGDLIAGMLGKNVFNACGKFSLAGSAVLLKYARKVVTSDTGLMHIASAFKKDILSLWGNTIPEFGMYPYLPGRNSEILENSHLKCRPCSKLGYAKCPKGHFRCMMELDEERIVEFLNT